jgi:hypothetical protein
MHAPSCILWANLTAFSLQAQLDDHAKGSTLYDFLHKARVAWFDEDSKARSQDVAKAMDDHTHSVQVRKTPSWPRSWANSSLSYVVAAFPQECMGQLARLLGQPDALRAAVRRQSAG